MTRTCDAIGCKVAVGAGRFMCMDHWRGVPVPLQRTINARYRALRNPRDLLRDHAYLEACAKAIERGQPESAVPNSYRRLLALLPTKEKS